MRKNIQNKFCFCLYRLMCFAVLALLLFSVTLTANAKTGAFSIQTGKDVVKTERVMLCPGGSTFGVKMMTNGVVVAGTTEISVDGKTVRPAYDGGLREKDIIIKIDGSNVKSVSDVTSRIELSEGKPLTFVCLRDGKEITLTLKPVYSKESEKYKLGIWVRDNTAGIGTLTFIDPDDGMFGGLGHGIYDIDTGELLPLSRGIVTDVSVTGIIKGTAGKPGEIRGYLKQNKTGALLTNCDCGVFGVFAPMPKINKESLLPIAFKGEVKCGPAKIRCTLDEGGTKEYGIEIMNINHDSEGTKCFTVHVTDSALLEKTGGIVQGMSGSPIIQNGKLVGAVTHVLINDPTTGYGIFIENMLNQMGDLAS
ncbi:MAG: SpoIVB peptidase [Ruminococcaceae bacterium]|nr:SpoIVB peptidase [Oscillospiraceae bacterium]